MRKLAKCQLVIVPEQTVGQAQKLLRSCLVSGEVVPGKHFREELAAEGLTLVDAWHVLRLGCVFKHPERHIKTGEWTYHVEGHEPDGKWLEIVFSFKTRETVFLITVFSVAARSRK